MILHGFGKISKLFFFHLLSLFDSLLHFWPWNINIHIQKITFRSNETFGSRFWTPISNFEFSFFPTSSQNLERSAGISNRRPESRTFGLNLERSARIWNLRPESRMRLFIFGSFFHHNIWYVWLRNINIHIQKIIFAATRNSGSLFFDLLSQSPFLPESPMASKMDSGILAVFKKIFVSENRCRGS